MKILLATSAAVPDGGGIASYNQELVNSLGLNNEFYLLTAANEHNVKGFSKTVSLFGNNINDYDFVCHLLKKIEAENFDLIINSNSEFITVVAPFLTVPIVSVAHFVDGILADIAGYNSDYISSIIALSSYGKEYLVEKFQIYDKEKVNVVYNFVNPTKCIINKTEQHPIVIVYPGGTSVKKSVDVVMEVAYRLKRTNLDFVFYWLGGDILPSSNFSILGIKKTTQMIHGDSRFILTGKVSREIAEDFISSANVFLLPSRGEGCPMSLLEAMRAGCIPIVSDAHHGSLELINNSQSGFVVKQGDSKSIFDLIKDIIQNHINYIDCYSKTKNFSDNELSSDKWVEKMNAIINKSLESHKKTIRINESAYYQSLSKFLKLKKADRRKVQFNSMVNRLKMDWIYLKWQGWK